MTGAARIPFSQSTTEFYVSQHDELWKVDLGKGDMTFVRELEKWKEITGSIAGMATNVKNGQMVFVSGRKATSSETLFTCNLRG